jgi:periplasmic divalent cation tolerance protein
MVAIIYTTIDDIKAARRMAHTLTEEQLVACVNIIPGVESVYRWKGKIENAEEVVLIAKTVDSNVKKTIQRIKKIHTYDVPDIIVIPVIGGLKDYLDYVNLETS